MAVGETELIAAALTTENVQVITVVLAYLVGRHGYLIKGLTERLNSLAKKQGANNGSETQTQSQA